MATETPAQCSPLPWVIARTFSTHNHPTRSWETGIGSSAGIVARTSGATMEEAEANAALILTAANSHAELLAALKECSRAIHEEVLAAGDLDHPTIRRHAKVAEQADAAIARAERRT